MKKKLKKTIEKNVDLKRKRIKFDKKKPKHKGWNWKTISIKKKG